MRHLLPRTRLAALALLALAAATMVGACAPAADTDNPSTVVTQAADLLAKKDLESLKGLACAGQEDLVKQQLGGAGMGDLAAMGEQLLPGVDMQQLLDAVNVDVKALKAGKASIDGDVAEVPVSGTVKVTFDKETMGPVLKQVLDKAGRPMTDDQLNALLDALEAYGSDVPVDDLVVRLVREDGAWKICQDTVPGAGPSASPG